MAFTYASLNYLLNDFKNRGIAPSGRLLTLSRYHMAFTRQDFNKTCKKFGINAWIESNGSDDGWVSDEQVFKALGFETIESMDKSKYEFADIIHDLNDEHIPDGLEDHYDFILDGGTMEHVFHLPNTLNAIYKMLKVNGDFIFDAPTFFEHNHGLYNFSPTLFHDYFHANHYTINALIPYAYMIKNPQIVYEFSPVINDICGDMPLLSEFRHHVWGSVIKTTETTGSAIPQQGFYSGAWDSRKTINEVLIDTADCPIYLYGTGGHTQGLLRILPERYRNRITGVISNDAKDFGGTIIGVKICGIKDITKNACIIISSQIYQEIIYDRIKYLENDGVRIVTLY